MNRYVSHSAGKPTYRREKKERACDSPVGKCYLQESSPTTSKMKTSMAGSLWKGSVTRRHSLLGHVPSCALTKVREKEEENHLLSWLSQVWSARAPTTPQYSCDCCPVFPDIGPLLEEMVGLVTDNNDKVLNIFFDSLFTRFFPGLGLGLWDCLS